MAGGGDGLTIIVRKPNSTPEEIRNWFINIRKIIPEDIPVITALVERDYPHIIPEERNGSGVSGENRAD